MFVDSGLTSSICSRTANRQRGIQSEDRSIAFQSICVCTNEPGCSKNLESEKNIERVPHQIHCSVYDEYFFTYQFSLTASSPTHIPFQYILNILRNHFNKVLETFQAIWVLDDFIAFWQHLQRQRWMLLEINRMTIVEKPDGERDDIVILMKVCVRKTTSRYQWKLYG